jgi:uncharacterized protein YecT (DUF1311 family)
MTTSVSADEPAGTFLKGTPIACPGATSEVAWSKCHRDALTHADRELNALYQQLTSIANENQQSHLRKMQRGWIMLRDAQCAFVVDYHDGAANPGKFGTHCKAVMTIRRVQELEQLGTGLLWQGKH